MKKTNKPKQKPKAKVLKDLAIQFEADLSKTLPITIQPDGSIVYKDYVIKYNKTTGNWCIYDIATHSLVEQYFLKTCALMAAKAYSKVDLNKFFEIKHLDNKYWSSHSDTVIFKHNIKTAKDLGRYIILLNRLEYSEEQSKHYKETISRMFKWTFV